MAILASALVTWIPRICPSPLSQIQGTAGSCDPLSQIPAHFHYLCLGLSSLVDGKLEAPQLHWLDLVVTIPSLFVAFRYKTLWRPFVWNCLDRPLYDWYSKWKNMLQNYN